MNDPVRSGVSVARFVAAGRRLRTSGRAATTKGRMSLRSSGVASWANGVTAWLARLRATATGRRWLAAGRSTSAKVRTLPSVSVVWRSAGGNSWMALAIEPSSEANARNTADEESTSCVRSTLLLASSPLSTCSEVISRRRFWRRVATCSVTRARSRWVGSKRRKTSWRSPPRPLSPSPAPLTSSCRYCRVSASSAP